MRVFWMKGGDKTQSDARGAGARARRARGRGALTGGLAGVGTALVAALSLLSAADPGGPSEAEAATDYMVFHDGLRSGWANASWHSTVNLAATPAYSGSRAISWRADRAWGGLYLKGGQAVATTATTKLEFALRASQAGQKLSVALYGDGQQLLGNRRLSEVGGDPPAGSYKAYGIPLSQLGAAGKNVTGIVLQDAGGSAQPTVLVDQVQLLGAAGPAGAAPAPGPTTTTSPSATSCGAVPTYPELRPNNATANATRGRATDPAKFWGPAGFKPYFLKINGDCTGDTEHILEWAAKKWGFDQLGYPDLAKAIAVNESWWKQEFVGDQGESFGLLQVRAPNWPDSAQVRTSSAFNADYAMAMVRHIYDGNSWLGDGGRGIRNALAGYNCGCKYAGSTNPYVDRVLGYNSSKPWKNPWVSPYLGYD